MTPVTQLSADQLMAQFEDIDQTFPKPQASLPGLVERHNAIIVELGRRAKVLDEAKEDYRRRMVDSFAASASFSIAALWQAHNGRELTDEEVAALAGQLHAFFVAVK